MKSKEDDQRKRQESYIHETSVWMKCISRWNNQQQHVVLMERSDKDVYRSE